MRRYTLTTDAVYHGRLCIELPVLVGSKEICSDFWKHLGSEGPGSEKEGIALVLQTLSSRSLRRSFSVLSIVIRLLPLASLIPPALENNMFILKTLLAQSLHEHTRHCLGLLALQT